MPKRISGVSARLLECAKSEFLEKGFQDEIGSAHV